MVGGNLSLGKRRIVRLEMTTARFCICWAMFLEFSWIKVQLLALSTVWKGFLEKDIIIDLSDPWTIQTWTSFSPLYTSLTPRFKKYLLVCLLHTNKLVIQRSRRRQSIRQKCLLLLKNNNNKNTTSIASIWLHFVETKLCQSKFEIDNFVGYVEWE